MQIYDTTWKIDSYITYIEQLKCPVEILKPSNPRTETILCNDAIQNEISGVIGRGTFKYVFKDKLTRNAKFFGVRFVFYIKQQGEDSKTYIYI